METRTPIPDWRTLLSRGLRRRCPQCGRGAIYSGWNKLRDRCEECDLKLLANEGDLWAYLILIDRALFLFPLVVMIFLRLNNPESIWTWIIPGALVVLFLVTLPHRNGVSLACDYYIRRTAGDLVDPEPESGTASPPPDVSRSPPK